MSLVTAEDRAFFEENGYLVVRNVVPVALCNAVIDAIWDFLGIDRDNPEDWYREPLSPGGMIEMYHHQSLWNVRQHPKVHQTFAELIGTEKLWTTLDRVNLKPPQNPKYPRYDYKGFTHWDVDTGQLPVPFWVQGVIYLADTDADMGGFQCIPGFHKDLEAWIKTQPPARNTRVPDMNTLPPGRKLVPIPGNAGDIVIWDRLLAHGNGHNVSNKPRFAQYVAMSPARLGNAAEREERIQCWRNREPLDREYFYGDPRRIEQTQFPVPDLTPLGRKLLGLDSWD
jgi:ectoine hydroxylase-related dioxygenase (phytanoyl-CoA dioxygenase family)